MLAQDQLALQGNTLVFAALTVCAILVSPSLMLFMAYVRLSKAEPLCSTFCRDAADQVTESQPAAAVLGSSQPSDTGTVPDQASPWTYLQKIYSQNRQTEQGSQSHTRKAAGKAASQSQLSTKFSAIQEVIPNKACAGTQFMDNCTQPTH